MGINSKNKGNKNERELCKFWSSWTGYEFARVPASGGLRWKKTDNTTGDILCSDDKHSKRFQFSIETKFHQDIKFEHTLLGVKGVKIDEFWEQALSDSVRAKRIPILFMRYNGMPKLTWFVALEYSLYISLRKLLPRNHNLLRYKNSDKGFDIAIINSNTLSQSTYGEVFKKIKG